MTNTRISLLFQDRHGDTPLHLCARYRHVNVTEMFLKWDAEDQCTGALHTTNRQVFYFVLDLRCDRVQPKAVGMVL